MRTSIKPTNNGQDLSKNASGLTDEELKRLISLAEKEERSLDAESILYDLIRHLSLTDRQFQELRRHCENRSYSSPYFKGVVIRESLMRELKNNPFTQKLFEECLSAGDAEVQKYLMTSHKLTRRQVEMIQEKGANRGTRNMAEDTLKQKIYNS